MRPLVVLSILIYGLILAGLATLQGAMLGLALPLVVYLGAGLLARPAEPKLQIARSLSADRVAPGAPVVVTLAITNMGDALAEVLIEDAMPAALTLVEGQPRVLTTLAPGATAEL